MSVELSYILYAIVAILCLLTIIRGIYKRAIRPVSKEAPVLLIGSTRGEVINGHQGSTPAGLPFTYLVTGKDLFSENATYGVFAVYLPFKTKAHIVGIPKGGSNVWIVSQGSAMEPVTLEGDYPDYFELYADIGQQADSRYVLDPKAMVFTIDFCKSTNWEIANSTLYFYSQDDLPSFEIVDKFVEEIRPAVEVASPKNFSRIPYGHTKVMTLHCPICNKNLVDGESWMECPDQHGLLLSGKQMKDYNGEPSVAQKTLVHIDGRKRKLTCPYCSSHMNPSKYQDTNITIDICSKCVYRWIDSQEAIGILGLKKPEFL